MDIKALSELIEKRQNELFDTLCTLIGINSENYSDRGNEAEIAQFINKMCLDIGLDSEYYSPLAISVPVCRPYLLFYSQGNAEPQQELRASLRAPRRSILRKQGSSWE